MRAARRGLKSPLRIGPLLPSFLCAPASSYQGRSLSTQSDAVEDADKPMFKKLLVANRGEIACRIMRTCKKMGIGTVAIYSEADAKGMHVRMADEAVCVGPAPSAQSYLNMESILAAVEKTGADCVHPGYGFMSENHHFASYLESNGVTWVGPSPKAMESLGDKIAAKAIAKAAGVSLVPGFIGEIESTEQGVEEARKIGYPVMIKASAGGGGKGIRMAWNDDEAKRYIELCATEAVSSFGDGRLLIEKAIVKPKHIELQVLGDKHGNVVYLNERECSIQRRHQKIVEEAPSPSLLPEVRKAMGEEAVSLGQAVGYNSAGTVEFLVDEDHKHYFLEMNTRLQVEHPVTELITGVDLVEQMIRSAAGRTLPFTQKDIGINGWSFEFRVYAEDPYRDFLPSIGKIHNFEPPFGAGIRVDTGVEEGDEISTHYDPMISKLITYGQDRETALNTMTSALDRFYIRGVTNNLPLLRHIAEHPVYRDGSFTTSFMEDHYPDGMVVQPLDGDAQRTLLSSALHVHAGKLFVQRSVSGQGEEEIENAVSKHMRNLEVTIGDESYNVQVDDVHYEPGYGLMLEWSCEDLGVEALQSNSDYDTSKHIFRCLVAGDEEAEEGKEEQEEVADKVSVMQVANADGAAARHGFTLSYKGDDHHVTVRTAFEAGVTIHLPIQEKVDMSKMIVSPMPGAVVAISVQAGDRVAPGQEVCVIEAMKMQNALTSSSGGVVKKVHAAPGDVVQSDHILVELE